VAEVRVWSEIEKTGSFTDCAYSSALMVLVAAGKRDFALGIYTIEERNELERADDRKDGQGVSSFKDTDVAVERLYRVKLRLVSDGRRPAMVRALSEGGRAYMIAGKNGNLKPDHPLRKPQPSFEGNHAVCVIPRGDGKVRWLDPLARMESKAVITDVETVLKWANMPSDARFLDIDQLAEDVMPEPALTYRIGQGSFAANQTFRLFRRGPSDPPDPAKWSDRHEFKPPQATRAEVDGPWILGPGIQRDRIRNGPHAGFYISLNGAQPKVSVAAGIGDAELKQRLRAAAAEVAKAAKAAAEKI
jgi:hypothetical protein